MPVDVAVKNPWTSIIRLEANGDVVTSEASRHDVALDRVRIVVHRAACTADYGECVPMQMYRMLFDTNQ